MDFEELEDFDGDGLGAIDLDTALDLDAALNPVEENGDVALELTGGTHKPQPERRILPPRVDERTTGGIDPKPPERQGTTPTTPATSATSTTTPTKQPEGFNWKPLAAIAIALWVLSKLTEEQ